MPELNPDGTVNLGPEPTIQRHDPEAISRCRLCDSDGYRGTSVCDHREHARGPGYEAAQAALAEIRHRKVVRAKQPYRSDDSDGPAATEAHEQADGRGVDA